MEYQIGPIQVAALIIGITQFIKGVFVLDGKAAQITTFVVAFLLTGLGYAYGQDLIPASALPYVELITISVGGALAAMGYYDLVRGMKGNTEK